jgi:hypothetical protein
VEGEPLARFDGPFDRRKAAHLLRRAGFGPTPHDLDECVAAGLEDTLAFVLADPGPSDPLAAGLGRALAGRFDLDELRGLQARWLHRMVFGPRPLVERMTLLWHDHFATSFRKVQDAVLMERQNLTLRAFALSSFRAIVAAVSRDPAMLLWLDADQNRKAHPNENFARELLELFTLGIGSYGEADVKEAARAFTGWHVVGGELRFDEGEHDDGVKTVLGEKGKLSGDDVVRIALDRPQAARFLGRRLLEELCHLDPDPALVDALARVLVEKRLAIRPVVATILRSRVFFSDRSIGQKVKSPVEYAVGAILALGARYDLRRLAQDLEEMGMSLYQPPDVSGWTGGEAWINAATLGARYEFARRLTDADGRDPGFYWDPLREVRVRRLSTPEAIVDHYLALLLAREVTADARTSLVEYARQGTSDQAGRVRGVVRMILTLPEAHLG